MPGREQDELTEALHRIETLIAALDALPDAAARDHMRKLLELVLDLHGLALARTTAMVAASANGPELLQRLGEDPHIRAVLLLHGLHPDEPEARVRKAIAALRQDFAERGIGVEVLAVGSASARLRVQFSGAEARRTDHAALGAQIETAVIDAAPELETVEIEGLAAEAKEMAAAAD